VKCRVLLRYGLNVILLMITGFKWLMLQFPLCAMLRATKNNIFVLSIFDLEYKIISHVSDRLLVPLSEIARPFLRHTCHMSDIIRNNCIYSSGLNTRIPLDSYLRRKLAFPLVTVFYLQIQYSSSFLESRLTFPVRLAHHNLFCGGAWPWQKAKQQKSLV
jgi:hypothetical protein